MGLLDFLHPKPIKDYRVGRFVSIGGKLAHVRKNPTGQCGCCICAHVYDCSKEELQECKRKLAPECYPKFIRRSKVNSNKP